LEPASFDGRKFFFFSPSRQFLPTRWEAVFFLAFGVCPFDEKPPNFVDKYVGCIRDFLFFALPFPGLPVASFFTLCFPPRSPGATA